ncbi:hypothetical protein WEN_02200 [Mycoplasma wenyonii str. Massachusetts]|uniref:Uncharacterized protein n=1 Tax=Mycoplasma wenyonii (strain Massachusetts) TaxID=1197325 RepID=I6ZF32_MYCWM|nr:hypothetical protein [Mycoplasma wenyonii]AFN65227.1 hypothetical protein WEN_02200 [Mycoplasma wenyonii str. Massachusetts]
MSLGILTLKIGLVTTVVGTSIATPILLNRGSSEINSDQVTGNSESQVNVARVGVAEDSLSVTSPRGVEGDSVALETSSGLRSEMPSSTIQVEDFDKKCFVVPADSESGRDIELLTCYDPKNILRKDVGISDGDELESVFHLYDRSKPNNPVKIDGSLEWNPSAKQLTVRLIKKGDFSSEYTFKVTGDYWGGISDTSKNLMEQDECVIYKATLKDSRTNSTHLLTCGDASSDYQPEDPKGIPLTDWTKND